MNDGEPLITVFGALTSTDHGLVYELSVRCSWWILGRVEHYRYDTEERAKDDLESLFKRLKTEGP